MKSAVEKIAATMYSITSSKANLGPVPTAEVELEGVPCSTQVHRSLLCHWSFCLKCLRSKKPASQSLKVWQEKVLEHLEPTSVALQNYDLQWRKAPHCQAHLIQSWLHSEGLIVSAEGCPSEAVTGDRLAASSRNFSH